MFCSFSFDEKRGGSTMMRIRKKKKENWGSEVRSIPAASPNEKKKGEGWLVSFDSKSQTRKKKGRRNLVHETGGTVNDSTHRATSGRYLLEGERGKRRQRRSAFHVQQMFKRGGLFPFLLAVGGGGGGGIPFFQGALLAGKRTLGAGLPSV